MHLAGEVKDDASDPAVVFKKYYYTARVTVDGEFLVGFRIHGGPMSWKGPWLEVKEETDADIAALRENWQ